MSGCKVNSSPGSLTEVKEQGSRPRWFAQRRDLLAATASGLVGALALATSTYNVYLQRQQVRAQVWPRLNLGVDWSDDTVTFEVQNRGVGPADIRRVRVWVDGTRVPDWVSAISALLKKKSFRLPNINEVEHQVMSPGLQISPVKMAGPDAIEILKQRRRLGIEICYCSTLEECWILSAPSLAEPPASVPVAACVPDNPAFESVATTTWDAILAKQSADAGPDKP
jgi:hypothetical protein